jgi:4-hydroxythreonine-4-phosphate dehydrogenase
VSKEAVAATLPGFRGQTEFIARAAGVREPVMLLAGPTLRTVPVTRHLPLRRVVPALSVGLIARAIRVTAEGLRRWFGVPRPRIAVCGVNPHAGEGGLLGSEDGRIVAPAVRRARRGGLRVTGPLPADVVFAAMRRGSYDAVVAMYHDQANIPIKTVEGARAVNATLGLPFLRTSPAHGTAFDIAGRGIADPTSMLAAVGTAAAAC